MMMNIIACYMGILDFIALTDAISSKLFYNLFAELFGKGYRFHSKFRFFATKEKSLTLIMDIFLFIFGLLDTRHITRNV